MPFYGSKLSSHMLCTPEGYLICKDVNIGRAGILKYTQDELGLGAGDRIFNVVRTSEENSLPAVRASFEGKPITDGHPEVDVDTSNYQYYAKGHVQNVRNNGDYLVADLFITDDILIDEIMSGKKRDVSCGYDTQYIQDDAGKFYQTNIRGNHLAVVETGRAGSTVRINDSIDNFLKGVNDMPKNVQSILADFDKKIKTVKTVDEFNDLIDKTSAEMEEAKQQDALSPTAPTPAPAGNEGGDMQAMLQAINSLSAKVDSLMTGKPTSDGTPEGDIDKAIAELQQQPGQPNPSVEGGEFGGQLGDTEDVLTNDDAEAGDLLPNDVKSDGEVINEDDEGRTSAKTPDNETTSTTVDGEGKTPDFKIPEDNTVAKDTALNILREARKQIAGLKDPNEKRRVTDAILKGVSAVTKANNNSVKRVMKVNRTVDGASSNKSIQNYYYSQNPHMKKKYGIK